MEKTIIVPTKKIELNDIFVERAFMINGTEILGKVDKFSLNPLRILKHCLIEKGCNIQTTTVGNDPWNIQELQVEHDEAIEVAELLKEIMEYRCCCEADFKWTDIIRQLPFEIAMQVSDSIMNYGKDEASISRDNQISETQWAYYAFTAKQMGLNIDGNPNEIDDCLIIPKDQPEKRKHLIYQSSRGGYNIKTQNYRDSSMDHYSWQDSQRWD